MQIKHIFTLALIGFIGVGCAVATKFTGSTAADARLQKDTLSALLPYTQAKLDCNAIESVTASPVSVSPVGIVTESWKLAGCGNSFVVKVVYTPDGAGGVGINVSPE